MIPMISIPMKKLFIYTAVLCAPVLFSTCSEKNPDSPVAAVQDRNIFGLNIPRGLTISTEGLLPGYIMFSVPNSASTYLIDRQGKVVHEWKGNYGAFNAYLMDDGSIVHGANDPDYPVFGFGGPYGRIQKVNWDGKMLWDYEYANEQEIVHHDFAVLPNGNILAIAYEAISFEDGLALGRKAGLMPESGPWMEKIIEIEPVGPRGGKIVWEWHLKDHIIQGNDTARTTFGNPAAHPELIDFNLGAKAPPAISQDSLDKLVALGRAERNQTTNNRGADIFHFNALNYNPELDQIVISSPALNELFILDHSTSTEEAAGHSGGKSGKGGDFLYRWGNPANYQRGDSTHRQLFGQHDVRWVEKGLPGAGNLTVFNNHPPGDVDFSNMGNTGNNYSTVLELQLPYGENGQYNLADDRPFEPGKPVWVYMAPDTLSFYSSFISGAHRLSNGNTFINERAKGRFFEVTPDGEILWEYLNPYHGEIRKPNGDPVNPMFMPYSTFRATFVPADHPAFEGRELKPLDPQPEVFKLPPPPATLAKE